MDVPRPKYNVLSLFAGAGGLDLGFEQTGRFETLAAVEYQPEFAQTLRINQRNGYFPRMAVIEADIRSLDPLQVARDHFPDGRVDVIIGGPPCETFSIRGRRKGTSDHRGLLTDEFARFVQALRPRALLMENVPRLALADDGAYLRGVLEGWQKAGYQVRAEVLRASEYGAATDRQRLIVLGMLGVSPGMPDRTHGQGATLFEEALLPAVTARMALDGLPGPRDSREETPSHHVAVAHTEVVVERFFRLREGEQDDVRQRTRLAWARPAPSLMAGNLSGTRSHIHPSEPRELTNRECARLHGFEDRFDFAGSPSAVCKQIANSVPVPFARSLAEATASRLDGAIVMEIA